MFDKRTLSWVTHKLSLIFTFILIYWTVIFISITVFDFKIFRENITETFYLSVFGILAILCGSALLNVMTNISIIADNADKRPRTPIATKKLYGRALLVVASFFLVFAGLYAGDRLNSEKKKHYLISSAQHLYTDHMEKFAMMDRFRFSPSFASDLGKALRIISQQDKNFQNVSVIVQGSIEGDAVFLDFGPVYSRYEAKDFDKADFILPTNLEERDYLNQVFSGQTSERRYSSSDGEYELYFPITDRKTKFIIYLSEHQRYGKYGS